MIFSRRDAGTQGGKSSLSGVLSLFHCATASLRDILLKLNPFSALRGPFHDPNLLLRQTVQLIHKPVNHEISNHCRKDRFDDIFTQRRRDAGG